MMPTVPPTMPHKVHADCHDERRFHDAAVVAAKKVQHCLLPHTLPSLAGWEFAAYSSPALDVTGDYLDVIELTCGKLALALGDVSGKGLGAGLVMACLHAYLHSRLPAAASDLPGLLSELNAYLLKATPPDMFVSLFLGVLDVSTGTLSYLNAGHPPPFLFGAATAAVELKEAGLLLGIFDEPAREALCVTLPPGSLFVLFSDGVTEARNAQDQSFHSRRLVQSLLGGPWGARPSVDRVVAALRSFVGTAEQSDDQSILIVNRSPCSRCTP
jgi:sigma-B regulation protein RsbU (phosphoserine phosphatase)